MNGLYLPVILGTARPGRRSEGVARLVVDTLKARDARTDLIDVADFGLSATGTTAQASSLDHYKATVAEADGFVIVAPEYNHGYPGELKLLLDSDFAGYVRKPVGFVSVSAGLLGGTRMVEQLRLVTTALRMVPVSPAVHVSEIQGALDEHGRFASPSLEGVLEDMLDEIEWFAEALRTARAAGA